MLNLRAIEDEINHLMWAHQVPGLAVSIVQNGQVIYARGFGFTSIEKGASPIQADTIFRIGSVTKPLTGTMIMRLVELGLLDLDTPIGDYVPALSYGNEFTLRMLLSHTSGLPSDLTYYPHQPMTLREFVFDRLPQYRRIAPTGHVYYYSNPGINLAAYVAEAVMQIPYTALMDEYVFQPLEMYRSTFDIATAATYAVAQPHIRDKDGNLKVMRPHIDNPGEYPCGFAFSTILDMANFMNLHLGYHELLNDKTRAEMHRTHTDRMDGTGYGLAFRTGEFNGVRYIGHNGAIGKYGAIMRLHPDQNTGVFLVFNRAPGFWGAIGKVANRLVSELLELPEQPSPKTHTATDLNERLFGTYLGCHTGLVEISSDGVAINKKSMPSARIGYVDQDFVMVNGLPCQRYAGNILSEQAVDASIYAGQYRADIDLWTVSVDDAGQLTIYSEDDREYIKYIPIREHFFVGDGGVIEFEFDEKGHISGLLYAAGYRFRRVTSAEPEVSQ